MARVIAEYVESLPPESRAPEALRQARLSRCLACPHLTDGTCALCGCYVEARAAKRSQVCPDVPGRWEAPGAADGSSLFPGPRTA